MRCGSPTRCRTGRIAAFRTLVYLFVAADITLFTGWVRAHAGVPGELYRPLFVARVLHLPVPTRVLVLTIFWTLLVAALAAASGRAHRLLGWTVFLLYFEWMIIAMSYGKVDHDRFGLLVALAVLPTAGARPARRPDADRTRRLGAADDPDRRGGHVLPGRLGEAALRRHRLADRGHADPGRGAPGHLVRRRTGAGART